jgi:hypothetical protein
MRSALYNKYIDNTLMNYLIDNSQIRKKLPIILLTQNRTSFEIDTDIFLHNHNIQLDEKLII